MIDYLDLLTWCEDYANVDDEGKEVKLPPSDLKISLMKNNSSHLSKPNQPNQQNQQNDLTWG